MAEHAIVQVIPHSKPGGMQQVARTLDAELPGEGVASRIVDLAELTASSPWLGPAKLAWAWRELVRSFRREEPDAVLAHSVKNAIFSLTAAQVAGVGKRIAVLHVTRPLLGEKRVLMLAGLGQAGVVTQIVCCGEAVKRSFGGVSKAVRERLAAVPNGIRLPAIAEARTQGDRPFTLVVASRLVEEKDLPTAIRAVAAARQPVRLVVCGDGEDRDALRVLAAEVSAPVEFAGNVTREALAERYAAADAFLFTTRLEGLPLVLIEAAAAGLPVIASDIEPNREAMGEAAIFCPPGDVAAFAAAIDRLAGDPAECARLRALGQERVGLFTVERMIAGYAAIVTA